MSRTRPSTRPAVRRAVLENGLVVIARENRASRSITVRLLVEAGAAFDPQDRAGTAALVALLLDRGAAGLTAETIAEEFDFLGAGFRAQTRGDWLEVETRLLSDHLPRLLERIRLLVEQPAFPEPEVRREKTKILTAIGERDQDTASVAEITLAATLFPEGHPYHAPAIGTRATVERIGRDDLMTFHRSRFGPTGGILAIVGDLDPDRSIERAAAVFGSWPRSGSGGRRATIPDPPRPAQPVIVVRPVEGKTQADIALGILPGLRRLSPDLPAALVLNSLVGEFSLGGRLGTAIREQAGLAYYCYSHFEAGLGAGPFVARAGVAPDKVVRAWRMLRRILEGVRRRRPTTAEIKDSKQALAASIPRRLETNHAAAAFLADCEFHGLGLDYPERLPSLIEAVDRAQVESAADRYLTLGPHALVVAGPSIDEEDLR
ncbi:MAG TPA: pitrilysin family protein [Candidatus Polarisedimenticolia bacterium]|nr:pitrilysin family protein [Candidatus Polarisedimenticolia bacterium]